MAYTIEQIGQRVMNRNPEAFKGFTAGDVGKRIIKRNPSLQSLVSVPEKTLEAPISARSPETGFVQSMAQGISKPFLSTFETVRGAVGGAFNLGQAAINKITGDEAGYQRNVQEAAQISSPTRQADYGYLGKVSPISKPKEAVGAGLELGSWLVPAGKVATVGKQVIEKGVLQTVKEVAKPTLKQAFTKALPYGGAMGALSGAGMEMQRPESTATDILKSAGSGSVFGAATLGAFAGAGNVISKTIASKTIKGFKNQKIINNRINTITDIESQYSKLRKNAIVSKDANLGTKQRISSVDIGFPEAVDSTGTLRTTTKGGVIDQYKAQTLDGYEGIGRKTLEKEGASVSPEVVREQIIKNIMGSNLEEDALQSAIAGVDKKINGLLLRANEKGNIPLEKIHDAKIFARSNVDYTKPNSKIEAKIISNAYQRVIENNSATNIKKINGAIAPYLQDIKFLESLDGRKVKGGKLGKYFAQITGNIAGAVTGGMVGGPSGSAVGTVLGGELGSRIRANQLMKTFKGDLGKIAKKSPVLEKAIKDINAPRLALPAPKKGAFRSSIGSGKTINLPAFGGTMLNRERHQSLGRQIQANANAIKTPSNIDIEPKVNNNAFNLARNEQNVNPIIESLKMFKKEIPEKEMPQKVSRVRQEELLNEIQDSEVALSEHFSKKPEVQEHLSNIMMELDISEAGKRIPIKSAFGQTEWLGQKSIFPQWVPEHLRDKKLFNKTMEMFSNMDNIKYPEANKVRQRELYDMIFDELDSRLGTNTNPIREKILKNYETINTGENTTSNLSGYGRNQSGTGEISTTGGAFSPLSTSAAETSRTGMTIKDVSKGKPTAFSSGMDAISKRKKLINENPKAVEFAKLWTGMDDRVAGIVGIDMGQSGNQTFSSIKKYITPEMKNQLKNFSISEPETVYRVQRKGYEIQPLTAWTRNMDWAIDHAKKHPDFEILVAKATPANTLVDINKILPSGISEIVLKKEGLNYKIAKEANKPSAFTPAIPKFEGFADISTKVIDKLKGRSTVSKQFISDLTNSGELKQVERELIRDVLASESETVNVQKFAEKVKIELLPLKLLNSKDKAWMPQKYESITLPDELRGNVANYQEHIWESPIKTSAGDVHFPGQSSDYFGHTRIEDMGTIGKTIQKAKTISGNDYEITRAKKGGEGIRRVIEVQSDLYQKGGLEKELAKSRKVDISGGFIRPGEIPKSKLLGVQKLQQYSDPTAHFRMIREEVKQAAIDGKTKLQFPTGETAMKIEGLGDTRQWFKAGTFEVMTPEKLKVGNAITTQRPAYASEGSQWIITDILGDGKFKAVPKGVGMQRAELVGKYGGGTPIKLGDLWYDTKDINIETFDISGKVDTSNPIYRFYEKEVGKYLRSKYDAKTITDDKGVQWNEVEIKPEMKKEPVGAFSMAPKKEGKTVFGRSEFA